MQHSLRRFAKRLANWLALGLVSPCALLTSAEQRFTRNGEAVFGACATLMAVLPGLPGMYLRRAFYHLSLDFCSLDCFIGFGAVFTHRKARVEDGVYVGLYSLVGSSWLKKGVLLGSRVSLLSGPALHEHDESGRWKPTDLSRLRQVEIGENVWIGEGAIVMVDVGSGSMVGAGAVVSTRVRPNVVVAGNPARFVRRLRSESSEPAAKVSHEGDNDQGIPSLH